MRVGVGVDPAEDRSAGAGCRFGSHVSLRSFRARLDRADGTLTGRDRMRLFGSAVSLHAPIRSCGGLGSPRAARDMSGNEGSPVGASGMWGHRAVRILWCRRQWYTGARSASSIQKISVRNVLKSNTRAGPATTRQEGVRFLNRSLNLIGKCARPEL